MQKQMEPKVVSAIDSMVDAFGNAHRKVVSDKRLSRDECKSIALTRKQVKGEEHSRLLNDYYENGDSSEVALFIQQVDAYEKGDDSAYPEYYARLKNE
jgi:hypothetical protein